MLTQAVKDLRRALGDDLHAPRYVETLPRLGYRLVAPARFLDRYDADAIGSPAGALDAAAGAPKRRLAIRAAAAALALITIAIGAIALKHEESSAATKPRWQASDQRAITADPGPERFPRISPDGTRVAYSVSDADRHNAHIVQRSLTQSRVMRLTEPSTSEEFFPVWSPDGATIAFARHAGDDCKILVAPALGGSERLVDNCYTGSVNYFSWAPDARHLVTTMPTAPSATDMAITLVSIDGGASDRLAYEHGIADLDLDARYSPDGTQIAFRRGASPYSDLYVVGARGGAVRQLTHLASRMRGFDWTRDGAALVFRFVRTCRPAGALHGVARRRIASRHSACSQPNSRARRAGFGHGRVRDSTPAHAARDGWHRRGRRQAARSRPVDRQRQRAGVFAGGRSHRVRFRSQRRAAALAQRSGERRNPIR